MVPEIAEVDEGDADGMLRLLHNQCLPYNSDRGISIIATNLVPKIKT